MLDMMSYEPGPTRFEGCITLYNELRVYHTEFNDNYLKKIIHNEIYKHEESGLGSAAGWSYYMKQHLIDTITNEIKEFINVKKRIRLKIRCICKFFKLYRDTLEKRYAPGGVFETEAAKYWNPLIWKLNKRDTIKYISFINNTVNVV
mgnify:CR=1 FL=1|tara:strand:- start:6451 stop:6891 length:441 start_codon:yes stop_codon:yes gene_type:complete